MRYSLEKIAQELGISKTTVSLILNGKARQARISREVEQQVREFCDRVNYIPNIHAQRMNKKHVKNIGLLIKKDLLVDGENPFTDPNISGITGGVVLAAEEMGFRVTIQVYTPDMDSAKLFDWFFNHEIDGLIYYGLGFSAEQLQEFTERNCIVVGIGAEPCEGVSTVNINNRALMCDLTRSLLKSGRKKPIFIDGMKTSFVAQERRRGFADAAPDAPVYDGYFSERRVYELIVSQKPDTDAIICANDDMAIGAIKALQACGIRCPEEVAVAGADDIKLCRYVQPQITTIDNCTTLLGKTAVELLLSNLRGRTPRDVVIESNVIFRQST